LNKYIKCNFGGQRCGTSSIVDIRQLNVKRHRTIILPVVLYGCATWSLTLSEERKLRVFENMVLSRIFGPRRDEVMGEWRRLHNKELNDLYSSPNIVRVIKSRRMRCAGHVALDGAWIFEMYMKCKFKYKCKPSTLKFLILCPT